jgi:hypothetical protein
MFRMGRCTHPAIDFVQTPLRGLLEWLKVDWTIPQWMKDLHALSFVMAGIYVRSWGTLAESKHRLSKRLYGHSDDDFDVRVESDRLVRTERVKSPPTNPLFTFFERLVAGVLLGFTCLAFFAWISAIGSGIVNASRMSGARVLPGQRPGTVLGSTITERADTQVFRFYSLLLTTAATLAAVAAFYGSNAVVPQLMFR